MTIIGKGSYTRDTLIIRDALDKGRITIDGRPATWADLEDRIVTVNVHRDRDGAVRTTMDVTP